MDKTGEHADSTKIASRRCQVAVPVPIRRGHMQLYDYLAGPAKNCPAGTIVNVPLGGREVWGCLLYTSPSPRDRYISRMPSSA